MSLMDMKLEKPQALNRLQERQIGDQNKIKAALCA